VTLRHAAVVRYPYARRVPGRRIIIVSWVANVVFGVTAIPFAAGVDDLEGVAIGVAVALFSLSLVVWPWAFVVALVRSSQGDDVAVASLYFTVGDAPADVRRHLFGALGVCLVVTIVTASANPFGVLVPMLPLGLVGLWSARYGTFPARPTSGSG
jgi:hypothetical protein